MVTLPALAFPAASQRGLFAKSGSQDLEGQKLPSLAALVMLCSLIFLHACSAYSRVCQAVGVRTGVGGI